MKREGAMEAVMVMVNPLKGLLLRFATLAARNVPGSIKTWVHHHRFVDGLSRRAFRAFQGSQPVRVESGPLAGMALAPSEHISHAHIMGTYELAVQEAIARLVRPGDICYDLGASIGYLSLVMAAAGARHIYAFEPAPHAAGEIRKHAGVNKLDNVTVIGDPVSDSRRLVRFALTDVAYGSGIVEGSSGWPEIELTSTTLDEFASKHAFPDFIKIDVEGEEDRVLEGARSVLQQRRTTICCEVHSEEDARQVHRILEEYGYRVTTLDGVPFIPTTGILPGEVQVLAYPG